MANKLKIKRSSVAGKAPSTSDLDLGELALNTYDGILYMKRDNGTAAVVSLGIGTGCKALIENEQTISADYTITSGRNAVSAGPITVASNVSITVPSGSTWTVV